MSSKDINETNEQLDFFSKCQNRFNFYSLAPNFKSSFSNIQEKFNQMKNKPEFITLLGLELQKNKKIPFKKVEESLEHFIENYLPDVVDQLYEKLMKFDAKIKSEEKDLENIFEISADISQLLQEVYLKFSEIEKINELMIKASDMEDFSHKIYPAKVKVFNLTVCFFEALSQKKSKKTPHKRSPLARDLQSYIERNEDFEEEVNLDQNVEDFNKSPQTKEASYEEMPDIVSKHQKLVDLYLLFLDLHYLVTIRNDDDHIVLDEPEQSSSKLKKFNTAVKLAAFPLLGATVGAVVGGPIGLMVGIKAGTYTTALTTAAGVTGSVFGYKGGKMINKKHNIGSESCSNE